jgi:hypothetical protein
LVAVRFAGSLAAMIAVLALIWVMRPGPGPSSVMGVQVTADGFLVSVDARGTDVWATIDNQNPVPVDVAVRVRGYDIGDHIVVEKMIGPFRRVPPGGSYAIQTHLTTTPLKSVTLEAFDVHPTNPPGS